MKLRKGTTLKNTNHNQILIIDDIYLTQTQGTDIFVARAVIRTEDGVRSSTPIDLLNKRIASGIWTVTRKADR